MKLVKESVSSLYQEIMITNILETEPLKKRYENVIL